MYRILILLFLSNYLNLYEQASSNDKFNEELFIETLQNSDLNYHFQFTIVSEQNLNDDSSCKLLPSFQTES